MYRPKFDLVHVRININQSAKSITFEIDGDYNDIIAFNSSDFGKLNDKILAFASVIGAKDVSSTIVTVPEQKRGQLQQSAPEITAPVLAIPADILEKILDLDERKRIPIMWHFSSKPSMAIDEFLKAAAKAGIPLSPSWSPGAGGNFRNRLVKDDKMFVDDGKVGKAVKYKLTAVGALKMEKLLADLKQPK